jgi:hypothetical protein
LLGERISRIQQLIGVIAFQHNRQIFAISRGPLAGKANAAAGDGFKNLTGISLEIPLGRGPFRLGFETGKESGGIHAIFPAFRREQGLHRWVSLQFGGQSLRHLAGIRQGGTGWQLYGNRRKARIA